MVGGVWNDWCDCRELHPDIPRAMRHAAVKLQSQESKRAGSESRPAHAISTKNKHLLVIYSIPTRGFTAALSVFRGTPPAKPSDCKIRPGSFGAIFCDRWAEPTGGEPRLSRAL